MSGTKDRGQKGGNAPNKAVWSGRKVPNSEQWWGGGGGERGQGKWVGPQESRIDIQDEVLNAHAPNMKSPECLI